MLDSFVTIFEQVTNDTINSRVQCEGCPTHPPHCGGQSHSRVEAPDLLMSLIVWLTLMFGRTIKTLGVGHAILHDLDQVV